MVDLDHKNISHSHVSAYACKLPIFVSLSEVVD